MQSSIEELTEFLKSPKPVEIDVKNWDYLRLFPQIELKNRLEREILTNKNPITYIENIDLSILESSYKKSLERKAYDKQIDSYGSIMTVETAEKILTTERPHWIKDIDYKYLVSKAEQLKAIEEKETILDDKIKEESIKTNKIKDECNSKLEEYKNKIQEIDAESKEVSELKNRIENQLHIINLVINEPDKIERIENYSQTFAPGNFEDLKKLAIIVKQDNSKNAPNEWFLQPFSD
jgi:hypothetical protein